jgi:Uncharacterised protein conserved in bacteria (DUF2336)
MAVTKSIALSAEFDSAFDDRSSDQCTRILHEVAKLFLAESDRLSNDQIALFDDVLLRLIGRSDKQVLASIGSDLCGVAVPPLRAIRQLAFDSDAEVAGPVLRRSTALSDKDIESIADTRGQQHLLEISGRQTISVPLSDILVERGDRYVLAKLIRNLGARFSDEGCGALVAKAMQDDELAEALVRRSDVLPALRKELVAKVNNARTRVKQAAPSVLKGKIKAAIATMAECSEMPTSADYSAAVSKMVELSRKGGLNDRSVNRFAVEHDYVSVAAALSVRSAAPVEIIVPLLASVDLEGLMVACKAARLNWTTTKMIIRHRPGYPSVAEGEIEQANVSFDALSLSVAQRTIRLW